MDKKLPPDHTSVDPSKALVPITEFMADVMNKTKKTLSNTMNLLPVDTGKVTFDSTKKRPDLAYNNKILWDKNAEKTAYKSALNTQKRTKQKRKS